MGRRKKKLAAAQPPAVARRFWLIKWLCRPTVWPYLILIPLTVAVYWGALSCSFASDDTDQLLRNPLVQDYHRLPDIFLQDAWGFMHLPGEPGSNYYRPIQFVAYLAIYCAAGFSAYWFHMTMILLHVANTLLVFRLGRLLLGKLDAQPYAATFAAALFAVHAANTDTVAWIGTLPELLMTLALLTMLLLFLHQQAAPMGWQVAGYAALFLLAILTKETAVVAPVLLAGYSWLYLGRPLRRELWDRRWLYLSLLLVFAVYLTMRYRALGALAPAQGQHFHLSPKQLVLNALVLMAEYFAKLVVPWNVSHFHLFEPIDSIRSVVVLSLVALVAFLATMFWTRKRAPLVSFGLLVILAPLLPVMNLTGINDSPFAERYLYLPSVGFVWIAAWIWEKLWNAAGSRSLAKIAVGAMAAAILAVFGAMTVARIPVWKDDPHLWEATARQEPNAAKPHKILAGLYQIGGPNKRAMEQIREWVRLAPKDEMAHNNLGLCLMMERKYTEAMEEFQKALACKPSEAQTYYNMGSLLAATGRKDEAEAAFRKALQLRPDYQAADDQLQKLIYNIP